MAGAKPRPLIFACKASVLGGLIGTWEAALTLWRDAEVTLARVGGAVYAGQAFLLYALPFFFAALLFALIRRHRAGAALFGTRVNALSFTASVAAAGFALFYLNTEVLPSKTHPLSLAVNAAIAVAAWAAIRFVPPPRLPRVSSVILVAALLAGAGVEIVANSRAGVRLPPPDAPPPYPRPNVILITLDTTRADKLGCYGRSPSLTPNLDRLAARGQCFPRAYCPMPLTGPSHASLLTGQTPRELGILHNGVAVPDQAETLAEALRARGYRTAAVVGAFPVSSKLGFAAGFEFFDDGFSPRNALTRLTALKACGALGWVNTKARLERTAGEVTARAVAWITAERRGPFFLWVHYYDAHYPYNPPAAFLPASASLTPALRYEGEIAYVDAEVGRLLDVMAKAEITNNVVVVVADHGEALGEHGYYYDHGRDVYEPCLRVPCITVVPRGFPALGADPRPGTRDDTLVTTTQIYDWLLAGVDGKTPPRPGTTDAAYAEAMEDGWHMRAALSVTPEGRTFKLVRDLRRGSTALYDVATDPAENADLATAYPETAAALAALLDEHFRSQPPAPGAPPVDRATADKLKSLGYVQ